jgi:thiol:disulfide interchange protein DsbA
MQKCILSLLSFLIMSAAPSAWAATDWIAGKHYAEVATAARPALAAGQTEITEVFSYGCPACNLFNSYAHKIKERLPAGSKFLYVPASFIPAEDWPMFQRAYCTAEVLGIADKGHDAMFEAVWTTGELATMDKTTGRLKSPMPTIEQAALVYNRVAGVKAADFTAAAASFSVDMKMKAADDFVKAYKVSGTPTLIIDRRYKVSVQSAGGYDQLMELVAWLVAKDKKQP